MYFLRQLKKFGLAYGLRSLYSSTGPPQWACCASCFQSGKPAPHSTRRDVWTVSSGKLAPHSTGRDVWTVSSGKPAPHITRRDVWTVSSGMPASHSTRRDVWTVSSGMPAGEIVGCELPFLEMFIKRSVARSRRITADRPHPVHDLFQILPFGWGHLPTAWAAALPPGRWCFQPCRGCLNQCVCVSVRLKKKRKRFCYY